MLASLALLVSLALTAADDRDDAFETRVRPLLAQRCYECHSARTSRPKGALRVDSRAALLKGGSSGPAIVAGDPDASVLVRALRYADEDLQMPPTGKLADAEIDVLVRWIADGAHWPASASDAAASTNAAAAPGEHRSGEHASGEHDATARYAPSAAALAHWAFQPIARNEPPEVADSEWSANPIDRFVKAELDARGLVSAPRADPRTLYLRACFELTGLPPTRDELQRFLADASPRAWSDAVDRLLESPHYAERSARRWLDLARYADSNGVDENLALAEAWRYRDWVVRAFQNDLPYDEFVTWQLAGDLVERDERDFDPLIATGFLVLGPKMLAEQDKEKLRADVIDEQLDVASRAFLGLTVGCARCHDHKFDPLPQTDYYALAGVFRGTRTLANTDFVSRWNERALGTREEIAARDAHEHAETAARAALETLRERGDAALAPRLSARFAAYLEAGARLAPLALLLEAEDASRGNWIRDERDYGTSDEVLARTGTSGVQHAEWDIALPSASRWRLLVRYAAEESRPLVLSLNGTAREPPVLGEITGGWKSAQLAWTDLGVLELVAGRNVLRLERDGPVPHLDALLCIPESALSDELARCGDDAAELVGSCAALAKRAAPANAPWIALWKPFAELAHDEFEARAPDVATRLRDAVGAGALAIPASLAPLLDAPPPRTRDEQAVRLQIALASAARAATAPDRKATSDEQAAADLLRARAGAFHLTETRREVYFDEPTRIELASAREHMRELERTRLAALPRALGVAEGTPEDVRVCARGSHLAPIGEPIARGPLHLFDALVARPAIPADASGRLELARWIVDPAHPLTSRVAANRIWAAHFGRGLVATPSNFGLRGEAPTHPQLLDWLAREFVAHRWSHKHMHRLILASRAWQSAGSTAAEAKEDADANTDTSTNTAARDGARVDAGSATAIAANTATATATATANDNDNDTRDGRVSGPDASNDARTAQLDPDARWLSRHARTRLDAELVRDRLLCAAERLDRTIGGSLLGLDDGAYVTNDQSANAARYEAPRRSLYLPIVRNAMYELFANFDYADPSVPLEQRPSTTIASQALFFLNSPLVEQCARRIAELASAEPDPTQRVERIWQAILLRAPRPLEIERALALVERLTTLQSIDDPNAPSNAAAPHTRTSPTDDTTSAVIEPTALGARREMNETTAHSISSSSIEQRSWLGLARSLLSSNEFLYID